MVEWKLTSEADHVGQRRFHWIGLSGDMSDLRNWVHMDSGDHPSGSLKDFGLLGYDPNLPEVHKTELVQEVHGIADGPSFAGKTLLDANEYSGRERLVAQIFQSQGGVTIGGADQWNPDYGRPGWTGHHYGFRPDPYIGTTMRGQHESDWKPALDGDTTIRVPGKNDAIGPKQKDLPRPMPAPNGVGTNYAQHVAPRGAVTRVPRSAVSGLLVATRKGQLDNFAGRPSAPSGVAPSRSMHGARPQERTGPTQNTTAERTMVPGKDERLPGMRGLVGERPGPTSTIAWTARPSIKSEIPVPQKSIDSRNRRMATLNAAPGHGMRPHPKDATRLPQRVGNEGRMRAGPLGEASAVNRPALGIGRSEQPGLVRPENRGQGPHSLVPPTHRGAARGAVTYKSNRQVHQESSFTTGRGEVENMSKVPSRSDMYCSTRELRERPPSIDTLGFGSNLVTGSRVSQTGYVSDRDRSSRPRIAPLQAGGNFSTGAHLLGRADDQTLCTA